MNGLLRELAPIDGTAWAEIESEAKRTLKTMLAARKLVDFSGPQGWQAGSVELGRVEALTASPQQGVEGRLRKVQPLVELRTPFELARDEIDALSRGAKDADLDPVRNAARAAALAEDRAIFHGYAEAGIRGIIEASTRNTCGLGSDYTAYLGVVAEAVHRLRSSGVDGPYAIALGPRCYTGLNKTLIGGFPAIEQLRRLLDGPIVSAPGVDGAVVMSTRGGDFELTVGQDFSIGYLDHSARSVRLYLQETLTFRVLTPESAVPLSYTQE
jgi:uncharacterized linocin/CFP29 family protein